MYIKRYVNLAYWEPWAGAIPHYQLFSFSELEQLDSILDEIYPDGIDETTLNDTFWFYPQVILDFLEIELDWDTFYKQRRKK